MSHIKEPCGHNYYRDECPMCSVSDEIEQEIATLKAEIERLESENGYLLALIKGAKREIIQCEDNYRKSVAEIERLREECKDVDWLREEYQKLIRENTRRGQIMVFCRARAAAWKRCAKVANTYATQCNFGFIEDGEFIVIDRHTDEVVHDKAPPDWREKWIPPSPEDKSALDEKPDSSES